MRKKWLYPGDPGWTEARLEKLLKGLRFAEVIGDRKVCLLILKEVQRVLLKDKFPGRKER